MFEYEMNIAVQAVRDAIKLSEHVAAGLDQHASLVKTDFSPVTVADYGVQAIVHRALNQAFPRDPIVAEEDNGDLEKPENAGLLERLLGALHAASGSWSKTEMLEHIGRGGYAGGRIGRFWTLDPIDGTKGFIRGDQYAVALALIENGRPVLGLLGCPRLNLPVGDSTATMQRGWICRADGQQAVAESMDGKLTRPLRTSIIQNPGDIRMCESVEAGHSAHGQSALIARELGVVNEPVRMDSQVKYAAVAAGMADVYLRLPTRREYQEKIWDHAAGALLLETSGGRISDVAGNPLDFGLGRTLAKNRGIIAAAPGIYDTVAGAVKKCSA